MKKEDMRLKEIEERLSKIKHSLDGLMPIWSQIDRRVTALRAEMQSLENERIELKDGQMVFDGSFNF